MDDSFEQDEQREIEYLGRMLRSIIYQQSNVKAFDYFRRNDGRLFRIRAAKPIHEITDPEILVGPYHGTRNDSFSD